MRLNSCLAMVLTALICACGGGGGGGSTSAPSGVPVLSNLILSPNAAQQNSGGGSVYATVTFDFSDSDGDITTVHLSSGGQSQDAAITGLSGVTRGGIQGTLILNTSTIGTFEFQISVLDAKGHASNTLSSSFQVTPPPPALTSISPQSVSVGGPAFTLTIQGSNFFPDSLVYWNGSPRSTTFGSTTSLQAAISAEDIAQAGTAQISVANPDAEGGASTSIPLTISTLTTLVVDTHANDLVWDAKHGRVYASVPSSAGVNGNSVLVIDPDTGSVLSTVFAGSEPNRMAISENGQFLYVGLDGSSAIKRFLLPALTEDITIPLGSDPSFGPYFALDLAVAPGSPHTLAVSLGCKNVSPSAIGGLIIYDDAVARSQRVPGWGGATHLFDSIQWGADATALYAANGEDSGYDFYLLAVNAAGITLTTVVPSALPSYKNAIHFDPVTQLVYSNSGDVLNPANGMPAGAFPAAGAMVPVAGANAAYFLYQDPSKNDSFTLSSYHLTRFTLLSSVAIPWPALGNYSNPPTRLIQWGSNGLASCGAGNPINLYNLPPASAPPPAPTLAYMSPATAVPGSGGFTLTIQGAHFFPDSAVYWNGIQRVTTYQNATSLQATITAQDLASARNSQVYVLNPANEGGGSNSLLFSVSDTPTRIVGGPANDLVWDSFRGVIYASMPSKAGTNGNSILAIDPVTGAIVKVVFAGSEPNRMALSDDGQFLYVSLDRSNSIKRFLLPALTEDIAIPLGSDPFFGPYYALDLSVAPASPHTLAVSLGCRSVSPAAIGGLVIWDDATPRPSKVPGFMGTGNTFDSIQWGKDASTLYGGSSDFFNLSVSATGVALTSKVPTGYLATIHFDPVTNLVYSDSGQVLNPANGQPAGTFLANGSMVPVPGRNAACFLFWNPTQYGFFTLSAYDLTHFTPLKSVQVPWAASASFPRQPSHLIQWGANGLASGGAENPINIYGGSFLGSILPGGTDTPSRESLNGGSKPGNPGVKHPTGLVLNHQALEWVGVIPPIHP